MKKRILELQSKTINVRGEGEIRERNRLVQLIVLKDMYMFPFEDPTQKETEEKINQEILEYHDHTPIWE